MAPSDRGIQLADQLGGVAPDQFIRAGIFHHHRPRRTNRVLFQGHPRPHKSLSSDPAAVFDDDGLGDQIESRFGMIMGSCAKESPLGKAYVGAKVHFRQTQDQDFVSNPNMIPTSKAPGEGNVDPAANNHANPHLGAKKA